MVFGLFKRKDPVCGMTEEKGKGIDKHDKWFCNSGCLDSYEKAMARAQKGGGCCGH